MDTTPLTPVLPDTVDPAAPSPTRSSRADAEPALHLHALTKRFGSVTAVDSLDLRVPTGQVLALLGRNGAGKSTAMEMMLGLVRPDAGEIRVHGLDAATAGRHGVIGAMLQNGVLLPEETVRSMLSLLRAIHARPLALEVVAERADITDLLGTRIGRLSGGQIQRVRFAVALLGDPDVLLLDEPTVGMDVESRRAFWERMGHVAESGTTIVFATHYLPEAEQFAQRVVVLDAGRVVADGAARDITARVAGRRLRVRGPSPDEVRTLPGVLDAVLDPVSRDGTVLAQCEDVEAALRALFRRFPEPGSLQDLEVLRPGLEDAFLALTGTGTSPTTTTDGEPS